MILYIVFFLNFLNAVTQNAILFTPLFIIQKTLNKPNYNRLSFDNYFQVSNPKDKRYKLKLYYYIQEGEIDINSNKNVILFNCYGASGGGAYAHNKSTVLVNEDSRNNVCHLNIRTVFNKHNEIVVRGGPIVPGEYTFDYNILGEVNANSDNRYINLFPNIKTQKNIRLLGRKGGFRIHCRGGRGSDGCIVPQKREDFWKIIDYISKSDGGTLTVKKSKDGMEWVCGNLIIDNMD